MKTLLILLFWLSIAVVVAAAYGIVNDQTTATISPEYFSVFKKAQFAAVLESAGMADAPTRAQAAVVGIASTWWFGLFLGIVIGISGIVGRGAPISSRRYILAVARVLIITLGVSIIAGAVAYAAGAWIKPDAVRCPFLRGIRNVRGAFSVAWWHNCAYLGALGATFWESLRVQYERRRKCGRARGG
jgi:hypothetical protein